MSVSDLQLYHNRNKPCANTHSSLVRRESLCPDRQLPPWPGEKQGQSTAVLKVYLFICIKIFLTFSFKPHKRK